MTAWDVTTATHHSSLSLVDRGLEHVVFKGDGLKMLAVADNSYLESWSLSAAWDLSTATRTGAFDTKPDNFKATIALFTADGVDVFIASDSAVGTIPEIGRYTLSTAWDVTTATVAARRTVGQQPGGLFFKPDGTRMYHSDGQNNLVVEYALSPAWDITTGGSGVGKSVTATPRGIFFKPDGTRLFIVTTPTDVVRAYDLSTPWDSSTLTFSAQFSLTTEAPSPKQAWFRSDGEIMFVPDLSFGPSELHRYDLVPQATVLRRPVVGFIGWR